MQCHGVTLFDLAIVTLTFKILYGVYLGNCKVQEVDTWQGYGLGVECVQHHGVNLIGRLTLL